MRPNEYILLRVMLILFATFMCIGNNPSMILQVGFLYLRYAADPKTLWGWFEPYIKDEEVIIKCIAFPFLCKHICCFKNCSISFFLCF